MPILNKAAKQGSREALKAGLEIGKDFPRGQSFKSSIRNRELEAVKRTAQKTTQKERGEKGNKRGINRKAKPNSNISVPAKQRRTSLNSDIFGEYRKQRK